MKRTARKAEEWADRKQLEKGICILCGAEKEGIPAKKDLAIALVRKARQILKMQQRHTIACSFCIQECIRKRQIFENEAQLSKIFALAFFFAVFAGGAYFGKSLWAFFPALIGSAIILILPYGKYFPDFS